MKKLSSILYSVFIVLMVFLFMNSRTYNAVDLSKPLIGTPEEIKTYNENVKLPQDQKLPEKEVFLTFDDGPCINNTKKVIKILNDNEVKATFFVVGVKSEENAAVLKELSNSGMSIGIHTYSHDYKKMYRSVESYFNDYEACKNVIKNITGKNPIPYVRMPGGSHNLVTSKDNLNAIKKELNSRGIKYVDWNVVSGDADSHEVPVRKIKNNVKKQCEDKKIAVVLMHDTYYKHFTVEALPDVIKDLKEQGFVFRTFDNLSKHEEDEMIRMEIINK